jgi:hypothetical protein
MRFQPTDRVPCPTIFHCFEAETLRRWQREGFPRDSQPARYFGLSRTEIAPIEFGPHPPIERAELDDASEWSLGAARDHAADLEQSFANIEERVPLRGRDDWPHVERLLDPASPARLPRFWDDYLRTTTDRDYPLGLSVPGPFTSMCTGLSAPGLRAAWSREPQLVERVADHLTELVDGVLGRLGDVDLDFILVEERSAYLVRDTIDEDVYGRLFGRLLRALADWCPNGVVVRARGNVATLVPIWVDEGVRAIWPLEVAAGLDARQLRREFGRDLVLAGNLDRHALAEGKRAVAAEVRDRVPGLLAEGGYFPAPDGPVHSEVELAVYEHFIQMLLG